MNFTTQITQIVANTCKKSIYQLMLWPLHTSHPSKTNNTDTKIMIYGQTTDSIDQCKRTQTRRTTKTCLMYENNSNLFGIYIYLIKKPKFIIKKIHSSPDLPIKLYRHNKSGSEDRCWHSLYHSVNGGHSHTSDTRQSPLKVRRTRPRSVR